MRGLRLIAGAAALLAGAALMGPRSAAAELTVSPLRQVITKANPTAEYLVSNPSGRIVEGKVRWIDLAATETAYTEASPSLRRTLSAAPYLIVQPAYFTLEPGGRTNISIRLKPGTAIPDGERRSHLLIETSTSKAPLRKAGGGLEVDVNLGLSTPVMLRAGKLAAPAIGFGSTRLERDDEGRLVLVSRLTRSGLFSAYGTFVATLRTAEGVRELGRIDGLTIHVEASAREVRLPLGIEVLPAGVMSIVYDGSGEFAGRRFAEKSFDVAPPKRD